MPWNKFLLYIFSILHFKETYPRNSSHLILPSYNVNSFTQPTPHHISKLHRHFRNASHPKAEIKTGQMSHSTDVHSCE